MPMNTIRINSGDALHYEVEDSKLLAVLAALQCTASQVRDLQAHERAIAQARLDSTRAEHLKQAETPTAKNLAT